MNGFEWTTPHTVADAIGTATVTVAAAMVGPGGGPAADASVLKAGGIDLLDLMKEGLVTPRRLVNLRAVEGLDRISEAPDGVHIGANVTLSRIAADPLIRARYRALAEAAGVSASPQIRNMATIAGNLLQRPRCWYFRSTAHHCVRKGGETCYAYGGDNRYHAIFGQNGCAMVHPSTSATALVALDAAIEIADQAAARRMVKLQDFFVPPEVDPHRENDLKPGELVTAIVLPREAMRSVHLKQGETDSFDWPLADVAVGLDLAADGLCRRAAVVLGAAAPVPHRAKAAEALLAGKAIDDDTAHAAAQAAVQGAMPLSHNAYKLPIFATLVRRAILSAAHRI